MVKRRKSRKRRSSGLFKSAKKLFNLVLSFYIPKEVTSKLGWAWFGSSRVGAPLLVGLLGVILLFSTVPVPYSSYMVQQKINHLLDRKPYEIKKKWVSLDKISWQMQMAVIASEDQKFDSNCVAKQCEIQKSAGRLDDFPTNGQKYVSLARAKLDS